MNKKKQMPVITKAKDMADFKRLNRELTERGFVSVDVLKKCKSGMVSLGDKDPSGKEAQDMAVCMGRGAWSNGPLLNVAWSFDSRTDCVKPVSDTKGKPLGLGYVEWGPNNSIPSVIPPLAYSSPYTGAPLRYIADLISGLGPCLMYRFPDGTLCDFCDAEYKIIEQIEKCEERERNATPVSPAPETTGSVYAKSTARRSMLGEYVMTNAGMMTIREADALGLEPQGLQPLSRRHDSEYWNRKLTEWQRTWYGYDEPDDPDEPDPKLHKMEHIPGAKTFLEENNMTLHLSQCMNDHVPLEMYYPTVGFNSRGNRRKAWKPVVTHIGFIEASIARMEKRNPRWNRTEHVYLSQQWRTLGAGSVRTVNPDDAKIAMYPAAMPQTLLQDMRRIVDDNQKTRLGNRPMWIVCPTFYPSLNKPYYPQPAWWSVFTSKAFDFSATILYDKYKQRENNTSWGRILYISLDYLDRVFSDSGYNGNPEKQQEFIDQLEQQMEEFLQHRENHGKFMRQWMWEGADGKTQIHNVEIVDVKEAINDVVKAGKEELELSTSPIFLALQVDPRLIGVPMVQASNGGTALREMALLKQQQLNVHQRLYLEWLNKSVCRWNGWMDEAIWVIKQMTLTTLDASKTGIKETTSSQGA